MATGHIRKRGSKDGKTGWQIVAETERDPSTGKRKRVYKTMYGSKREAEAMKRKLINDIENGAVVNPSTTTVKAWMWEWLRTYKPNIKGTTRMSYEEKIKGYIVPELGEVQLKALSTTMIQRWLLKLRDEYGVSPKTIRNALQPLKQAMDKAVVLRKITYNPCVGVVLPKGETYQAEIYDQQEIKEILDISRETDMYLVVLLELGLGLRRGELLALRWKNVDLDKGQIYICESRVKGEKGVEVTTPKSRTSIRHITIDRGITEELKAARAKYRERKMAMGAAFVDSDLVVCQPNGKPYMPDSMSQKWRRFLDRNDVKAIRFHDLRHSCATAMVEKGVSAVTVKDRLGHADIQTTLKYYTHNTKSMDSDAAKKLDDLLFA